MKLKGQVERFAHEILLIQYFMQHAIDSSVVKSTIYEKSQNYTVKKCYSKNMLMVNLVLLPYTVKNCKWFNISYAILL